MKQWVALGLSVSLLACGTETAVDIGCVPAQVVACLCSNGLSSTAICDEDGVPGACGCGWSPPGDATAPQSTTPDGRRAPNEASPPSMPREEVGDATDQTADAVAPEMIEEADSGPLEPPPPEPSTPETEPPDPEARECPGLPETVRYLGYEMFRFEASHPAATALEAFPGAAGGGVAAEFGPACSRAGVRPWHSVSADEAQFACEAAGWRVCTESELRGACSGAEERSYAFGDDFDAAACNLRQVYRASDAEVASESPTGAFPRCVTPEGTFDLTGNLWEWASGGFTYVGAGWRLIAEQHRDEQLVCDTVYRSVAGYRAPDIGFRCCRDLP